MTVDRTELSGTWQQRFAYFDRYGPVWSTPEAWGAYQMLPFLEKMRVGMNLWAFLFGPLYFFVKGMWRKGLTLLAAGCLLTVPILSLDVSSALERFTGLVVPVFAMVTANYAYYLHVVRGSESWNPFEGRKSRSRFS